MASSSRLLAAVTKTDLFKFRWETQLDWCSPTVFSPKFSPHQHQSQVNLGARSGHCAARWAPETLSISSFTIKAEQEVQPILQGIGHLRRIPQSGWPGPGLGWAGLMAGVISAWSLMLCMCPVSCGKYVVCIYVVKCNRSMRVMIATIWSWSVNNFVQICLNLWSLNWAALW